MKMKKRMKNNFDSIDHLVIKIKIRYKIEEYIVYSSTQMAFNSPSPKYPIVYKSAIE